jgi:hypothetical protein
MKNWRTGAIFQFPSDHTTPTPHLSLSVNLLDYMLCFTWTDYQVISMAFYIPDRMCCRLKRSIEAGKDGWMMRISGLIQAT